MPTASSLRCLALGREMIHGLNFFGSSDLHCLWFFFTSYLSNLDAPEELPFGCVFFLLSNEFLHSNGTGDRRRSFLRGHSRTKNRRHLLCYRVLHFHCPYNQADTRYERAAVTLQPSLVYVTTAEGDSCMSLLPLYASASAASLAY